MDERLPESLTQSERGVRERVSKYLDQAVDYARGTSRWTKLTFGGAVVGTSLLVAACASESVQPTLLQLNQDPKVELAAKSTLKELTTDEQIRLSRTIRVMHQFINLDERSSSFLNNFVSETGTVPEELIRSQTSKKNTGGSVSVIELYQSAQDKHDQADVLRAEVHTNSQGQTVSETYRFGISDNGGFIAQKPEEYTPKRILDQDPITGEFVEFDEDVLGPEPLEVDFTDLYNRAQGFVKGAEEISSWNELQNQRDTRFVDAVASASLPQPDGSVVRFIVYSSEVVELEITYPQHKADPIKRPPLPGQLPNAFLPITRLHIAA